MRFILLFESSALGCIPFTVVFTMKLSFFVKLIAIWHVKFVQKCTRADMEIRTYSPTSLAVTSETEFFRKNSVSMAKGLGFVNPSRAGMYYLRITIRRKAV